MGAKNGLSADERDVIAYLARCPDGDTDDGIAEGVRIPWGTAKAIRHALWRRGYLVCTGKTMPTRTGTPARAYRLAGPNEAVVVEQVALSLDDRANAVEDLQALSLFLQHHHGLDLSPSLVKLARHLEAKMLLAEKRRRESGQ